MLITFDISDMLIRYALFYSTHELDVFDTLDIIQYTGHIRMEWVVLRHIGIFKDISRHIGHILTFRP